MHFSLKTYENSFNYFRENQLTKLSNKGKLRLNSETLIVGDNNLCVGKQVTTLNCGCYLLNVFTL